ncbi:MAG TPA: enoyl-CoA hydratase/isomerase family protein, partial [Archangium sp.]|nr:enoyl-CoA hydratase/isomerase family protein [Archangium sp.]
MEAGEAVVRYQAEGGQALLTIDRPKARNALSPQVLDGLMAALDRAEADPAARVVVLTGAGEKVFCAGGDLGQMGGEGGFLATHDGRRAYGRLLLRLQDIRKPTVARVNGHALAGGLGLVLACDLAVAAEHAEVGTPEIDVGLLPMMMMALLQRHLGRKRALEMVLTGE